MAERAQPADHQDTTMPFDLKTLEGKLDGETLTKLTAHVDELSTRAESAEEKERSAKRESIEGRKKLKAERDKAFEKLGITDPEELESLQDAKGQGEATKQLEAQVKKLSRERDEAFQARDELGGKVKTMTRSQALAEAMQGLRFKNPADVQVLLERRLVEEGDDVLFKTDEGKLVPIKDGAAWFAKTRPDYVEAQENGGQGSGFKGSGGGGGGAQKGDLAGSRDERKAALGARFPELAKQA